MYKYSRLNHFDNVIAHINIVDRTFMKDMFNNVNKSFDKVIRSKYPAKNFIPYKYIANKL